jgi:hypothetical protein
LQSLQDGGVLGDFPHAAAFFTQDLAHFVHASS